MIAISKSVAVSKIRIEELSPELSVCKVEDYSQVDLTGGLCFIGSTDEEKSLVCPTDLVPQNAIERDDGWRAMRIKGVLDFALIGILSGISTELARHAIGIFAVSTFNTLYTGKNSRL